MKSMMSPQCRLLQPAIVGWIRLTRGCLPAELQSLNSVAGQAARAPVQALIPGGSDRVHPVKRTLARSHG
jgi:hypothetical protein